MGAHVNDFDSVYDIFNRNVVYVVPTFQRPYAWEENQISDLINDISHCCDRENPYHYLSPIHLIEVNSPQEAIWKNYTDSENKHIATITGSGFSDDNGKFKAYLVVDGQQRLITLFSILSIISGEKGNFLKLFCDEEEIPKVILNPAIDHLYFCKLLNLSSENSVTSKCQIRLAKFVDTMRDFDFTQTHKDFITGRNLVSLLITLDPAYGLQTFLTLNDRGKALTTFEKLKSLMMEYDFNFCDPSNPVAIHNTFGKIYVILDHKDCYVTEDQFVQLCAINLWVTKDNEIPAKAADTIFKTYFRSESPSMEKVGIDLHNKWLPAFSNLSNEIEYLTSMLNGSNLYCDDVSKMVENRKVGQEYRTIFGSLKLSIRSLAVLIKFREIYRCEWHDRLCDITLNNEWIKRTLLERSNMILGNIISQDISGPLNDLAKKLHNEVESIPLIESRKISLLHLVEMMELMVFKMGSTKPGTYAGTWNSAFLKHPELVRSAELWLYYITSYGSRDGFYYFLLNGQPDARDGRFRYILFEYEFSKYGKNIHFNKDLQLEHIFPQNVDVIASSLSAYGFSDVDDYQQFSERLGNKVFFDSSLNQSIKDQPIHVKSSAYGNQAYARTIVAPENRTQSSIDIGTILQSITDQSHYKIYLELRQIEIMLFSLQRF
jgi:hypothetical protein